MSNITFENGTELHMKNTAYALVFGSVMTLGLPLNAASLWILVRCHSLKHPSAVFMVNLAVSDLLLVVSLSMRVYFYATGAWPLGHMACICFTMLFRNNIRSSAIFITFISVDRLLAVVYPLRSRHLRTAANALKAVALVWLFVLVMYVIGSVEFSGFLHNYNESTCFEYRDNDYRHTSVMMCFRSVVMFALLAVNVVCTILVSWTLRRRLSDSAKVKNKVNVMLIFVMSLVLFSVCFLPLTIGLLTSLGTPLLTPLICLASVNCCLDPLLYYFSLDAFWRKKEDTELGREQ